MREPKEHEITIGRLLNFVHIYTERLEINVVLSGKDLQFPEVMRLRDFNLSDNACLRGEDGISFPEKERLLKYYANVPVWNLCAVWRKAGIFKNDGIIPVLVVHCHYEDIREGYLREKADIKKAKQRAYRKQRKKLNE